MCNCSRKLRRCPRLFFKSKGEEAARYNLSASSRDCISNSVKPSFCKKVRTVPLSWFISRFIPGNKDPFKYRNVALRHPSDMESHKIGTSRHTLCIVFDSTEEPGLACVLKSGTVPLTLSTAVRSWVYSSSVNSVKLRAIISSSCSSSSVRPGLRAALLRALISSRLSPRRTTNSATSGISDEHLRHSPAYSTPPTVWRYDPRFELRESEAAKNAALSCSGTRSEEHTSELQSL